MKRGRLKISWDEVVKEDMKKRGLCITRQKQVEMMMQKSGRPRLTGKTTLTSRQKGEREREVTILKNSLAPSVGAF